MNHRLIARMGAPLVAALLVLPLLNACGDAAEAGGEGPSRKTVHVDIRYSRFIPSDFTFPVGTTVRFVIRNSDPIEHEFILGNRARQDHVEKTSHPEHVGSVPGEITIHAGETATTTYTFTKVGVLLIGCHEPGHYAYGMRGRVTVTR